MTYRISCLAFAVFLMHASGVEAQTRRARSPQPLTQEAKPKQAKPADDDRTLVIYNLRFLSSEAAASMLGELLMPNTPGDKPPRVRILPNQATNSLVVHADEAGHALIRRILERLDAPTPPEKSSTRIIRLPESFSKLDQQTLEFMSSDAVDFHADLVNRLIFARGDEKRVQEFEKAVELISDIAQKRFMELSAEQHKETTNTQLRILWLKTGADRPLPRDLNAVAASLSRIGIEGLGLAGQLLANVSANQPFQLQGTAQKAQVEASGTLADRRNNSALVEIQIAARAGRDTTLQCESTIRLRPGQLVVLGMSPDADGHSVFVVQMLEDFGNPAK